MNRLAFILMAFLIFSPMAQARTYDPPLTGDMAGLEVFATPRQLPDVMLSHLPGGLSYLSEFKGRILVLNVWATWCPPCIEELPSLNAIQLSLGNNDFKVIAVSLEQDHPEIVKKFMDDHNLKALTPYVDANKAMMQIPGMDGASGVPVSLFIDRKMRVVARLQGGADWNGRSARAVIEYFQKNMPGKDDPD
jgi:thiol-disulfide isomerase/thioredoxin